MSDVTKSLNPEDASLRAVRLGDISWIGSKHSAVVSFFSAVTGFENGSNSARISSTIR